MLSSLTFSQIKNRVVRLFPKRQIWEKVNEVAIKQNL